MGKYANDSKKRRSDKTLLTVLSVILVVLLVVVGAAVYVLANYHIVGMKLYPKDLEVLDLREESIQPRYFDKLSEKMPDTDIRWNIPFQGGTLADDAEEVTVTSLSAEDVEVLDYARQLKTVQAEGCSDYENLELLRQ